MSTSKKAPQEILKSVKRDAKRLSKKLGVSLSAAQEKLARDSGYQSFHELTTVAKRTRQPSIVCFDIETLPFSEDFRRAVTPKDRLQHAPQMRLACVYSVLTKSYQCFEEAEHKALIRILRSADTVVSFNGKRFDELVLRRHYGLKGKVPAKGLHVDIFEIMTEASGFRVSLNVAAELNLGESKHTAGRDMAHCTLAELRAACQSDVSQTYRLWELFVSNELKFPKKRLRERSEREASLEWDTVGQFLPEGDNSELDELLYSGADNPFDYMTEGQFADALAGFR